MDKAEISSPKFEISPFCGYEFEKNNFHEFCPHRLSTDADNNAEYVVLQGPKYTNIMVPYFANLPKPNI